MNIDALRDQLTHWLNDSEAGRVLCQVEAAQANGGEDRDRVSAFLLDRFDIAIDPDQLIELSRDAAIIIAANILKGPQFGPAVHTKLQARELAQRVLAVFEDCAKLYSPYTYSIASDGSDFNMSGQPLLPNSWELGFFAIDSMRVGVLWVGDED